ncbi:MAG: transcription antitermination factor NusB [Albidovulum sp.]|nr:transcription antitermination factor NusB [Albidovulum sp.]MDE0532842.1 transcription antitermination factor NusB [Albidovulum sp.]
MKGPNSRKHGRKRRQLRLVARFHALQALSQMEATGQGLETIKEEFEEHRFGAVVDGARLAEADKEFFDLLITTAVEQQSRIDKLADSALVDDWPIDRIDPTLRALFRAAGAELVDSSTPPRVTINEFLEVAKAFYPEGKEMPFVNGVLDHMAREERPSYFSKDGKS